MRRPTLLLSALLSLPLFPARPADITLARRWEWPDRADVSWSIREGDLRILGRSEAPGGAGPGSPGRAALGIALPGLLFGPLRPEGLLREAADPLGFYAWSGVSDERTSIVLDGALPVGREGLLCMPFTRAIGFFCLPRAEAGMEYGAFFSLPWGGDAVGEAVVSLSRPDTQTRDEWFLSRAPYPGGTMMSCAGRLLLGSRDLNLVTSLGATGGQYLRPGAFGRVRIAGRARGLGAAFAWAGASPDYRVVGGPSVGEAAQASAAVTLGDDSERGILEAGYSHTSGIAAFAPAASVPAWEVIRVALSRDFTRPPTGIVTCTVEAEKRIGWDDQGIREEGGGCMVSARVPWGRLWTRGGMDFSDSHAFRAFLELQLRVSPRTRLGLDASGDHLAGGTPRATILGRLELENEEESGGLEIGLKECPVSGPAARYVRHFRLSLSWSFRDRPGRS